LQIGSYGLYKPAFDVFGRLNSKLAYRVDGTFETTHSYRDVVHAQRYYVNPSFLIRLGKKAEWLIQGDYLDHHFTPDFGVGSIDNSRIPDLPRSAFLGASWSKATTEQATASALLKYHLNDFWQLTALQSYQYYHREYYSTEKIQAAANGDWARSLNRTRNLENYALQQIDLTGKFERGAVGHTLLTGVDADRYLTKAYTFDQPAIYDTVNVFDPSTYNRRSDIPGTQAVRKVQTPTNRIGVYVQDLLKLTEKWKLLVGLRWSYQHAQPARTTDLRSGLTTTALAKTDQAFSPRLGLVFKPLVATSVFVSYASSFTVNTGTDVFGNALSPSLIDQYEVGVKNDLFRNTISLNLTAYRIVNNNLAQTAEFAADGVTPNNNTDLKQLTGQTTSDGLELDITGHPAKELDLIAGYSYNFMRYTKTPDTKGSYIRGERLIGNPAQTANVTAFYTFRQSRIKGLKIGFSCFYTGSRFGGFNNTKGQVQTYSRLFRVPGYTTCDLSAAYSWGKFLFQARLSNLTNTFNFYVHENYSINPIPPRQLTGTVAFRF
jgi:iron complex outermembrane recepter protein